MADQNVHHRSGSDSDLKIVWQALGEYPDKHPLAEVGVFRRRQDAIAVRIIDPDFQGMSLKERNDRIWDHLATVSDEITEQITVLLLMTPAEAAEVHFTRAEFDTASSNEPVRFMKEGLCFRERLESHDVYVTIGRPLRSNLDVSERLDTAFKFDFPPGIMATDDGSLSVDTGHLLRDDQFEPRWFDTIEQAKEAAIDEARRRLAQLATA